MYNERTLARHYAFGAAWLLLGVVVGLRFPDVDVRLQWLIPSSVLLHRSILTHGLIASLLLLRVMRRRGSAMPSLRLFAVGLSVAFAVHLCFDFFPRGWSGFALIHVPLYGRTTALFSQAWIILSIVTCLYVAFTLVRTIVESALGVVTLFVSFIAAAVENAGADSPALLLLAFATAVAAAIVRKVQGAGATRP